MFRISNWVKKYASLSTIAVSLTMATTPSAQAQSGVSFDREGDEELYVFGDSLSDSGNVLGTVADIDKKLETFDLSIEQFLSIFGQEDLTPSRYFKGRFSNGEIWTDYIRAYIRGSDPRRNALLLGRPGSVTDQPFTFAHGGAIVDSGTLLRSADPGLATRVPAFIPGFRLGDQARHFRNHRVLRREGWFKWRWRNAYNVSSGDFASISIGGNDYRSGVTDVNALVSGTVNALDDIRDRGIRQFFVLAVPDITLTPLMRSSLAAGTHNGQSFGQAEFNAISNRVRRHNDSLRLSLNNFAIDRKAEVYFVRADRLLAMGLANPGLLGFRNVTTACLTDGLILNDCPDSTLFYDPFHPTRRAQQLIGELAIATMLDVRQGSVSGFARTSALGEQALVSNQLLKARFSAFQNGSQGRVENLSATSLALSVNGQHSGMGYADASLYLSDNLALSSFSYFDGQIAGPTRQQSLTGLNAAPMGNSLDFQRGEWIATIGTDVHVGNNFMAGATMSRARKRDTLFASQRSNNLEQFSIYGAHQSGRLFTGFSYHDQTAEQQANRFSGAQFVGSIETQSQSRARTLRLDSEFELPFSGLDATIQTKVAYSRHNHDAFVSRSNNGLIDNDIPARNFHATVGYVGAEVSKSFALNRKTDAVLSFQGGMMATSSSDIGFTPVLDDTLAVDPEANPVGFADPLAGRGDRARFTSVSLQVTSSDLLSFAAELNTLSTSRGDQQVARVSANIAF